jgi:hypothetical protein
VITLSDIIDNYNIDDNTILKMDCQGCEYDVILNDYEHIKAFKEVIFEYHEDIAGKPYQELLKRLSNDYNCVPVKKNKNYGTIYCITKR